MNSSLSDRVFTDGFDVLANFTQDQICEIGCGKTGDDGWSFEVASWHSIASEWNLVCDKEYLLPMTETFFYVGGLTGCCFIGYLSDVFGRRKVVMASALLSTVCGLQVLWIGDFYLYVAVRYMGTTGSTSMGL